MKISRWDTARALVGDAPSLLLGNGSSRAIWDGFGYESLWDAACTEIPKPLTKQDKRLFDAFETKNFERVLSGLATARKVDTALGFDDAVEQQSSRYRHIQQALTEAVHNTHIPWLPAKDSGVLARIGADFTSYQSIYSTNYDLLLYWSTMAAGKENFVDYFWTGTGESRCFDIRDTEVKKWNEDATRVYYLHGALHLFRRDDSEDRKRVNSLWGGDLLTQFGSPLKEFDVPLIVTEGDSASKRESVGQSDYLRFTHEALAEDVKPLVIFGHELDPNADEHLIDAITETRRIIVVSIYQPRSDRNAYCERLLDQLKGCSVSFFDSSTHPLGASDLKVLPVGNTQSTAR